MIKNTIIGVIATVVICYVSYNLGKVNTELSAQKLQKSLTKILNNEETVTTISQEELLKQIRQLKETATSNSKEIDRLAQDNKELKNKLKTKEIEIEKIAKKILEMDLNTIFDKIKNDEKPDKFPNTTKELIDVIYMSIKNSDHDRILKLLNTLIELIAKTNQDYLKLLHKT